MTLPSLEDIARANAAVLECAKSMGRGDKIDFTPQKEPSVVWWKNDPYGGQYYDLSAIGWCAPGRHDGNRLPLPKGC